MVRCGGGEERVELSLYMERGWIAATEFGRC